MLRSILEFVYPIVTLSTGDVSEDSLYCKIGGFFTAWFFEASDLMIFIIAIHTAVYVFNPKLTQSHDEGGLWRWRYYVFALWFFIPALLAGLAFINPTPYVPLVTWCYLPARPLVWRYTLAWGPRYFIFFTISVLYVALYIYVRRAYRTMDRTHRQNNSSGSGIDSEVDTQRSSRNSSVGHGAHHGFHLPHPSYFGRKGPSIPLALVEEEKESRASASADPSVNETPSPTFESPIVAHPPPVYERPPQSAESRNMSFATTLSDALPPSMRGNLTQNSLDRDSFTQRRARVQRQMRTLFIFPIVYFIMWIPPFINHLYQIITYDSNASTLPPGTFVVTVLATIFLPSQGFVNVCIYAARERPWRRRQNTSPKPQNVRSTRTNTFSDWCGFTPAEPSQGQLEAQIAQAKNTYAKTSNATLAAYARRDIERGERELARSQKQSSGDPRPPRANWWETQNEIEGAVNNV
jgi:G protein-coupled receptor GPR1